MLPEILIGTLGVEEAWARYNGSNRVNIYGTDELKSTISTFPKAFEKLYLGPHFQSSSNDNLNDDDESTIRLYIVKLLEEELRHMRGTPDGTSTAETPAKKSTKRKRGAKDKKKKEVAADGQGKKKEVAADGQGKKRRKCGSIASSITTHDEYHDLEPNTVLEQFENPDTVPDEHSAERIGQIKGRLSHHGFSIPKETVIEAKHAALATNTSPWSSWPYTMVVDPPPTTVASSVGSSADTQQPQLPSGKFTAAVTGVSTVPQSLLPVTNASSAGSPADSQQLQPPGEQLSTAIAATTDTPEISLPGTSAAALESIAAAAIDSLIATQEPKPPSEAYTPAGACASSASRPPSPVKPRQIRDKMADFTQAWVERRNTVRERLQAFPTLWEVTEAYQSLPKYEMDMDDTVSLMMHFSFTK